MPTRLTKPVTRVIEIDGKPMNVTLSPLGISFREYKRRTTFLLPYGSAWLRAVTLFVDAQRREKGKTRKLKVRRGSL
jgi:hypothetical protein